MTNIGNMEGEGPLPVLEIPTGETVQFNLTSEDVIHAFWVPEFLFKRDVIPGHPNHFSDHRDADGNLHRALQRAVRPLPQPRCCLR